MHTDAGGEEQVGGQADHRVDMAIFQQLGADAFFCATTEQHAVGQDDGHHAVLLQVVESVQQKAKSAADFGAKP